MGEDGRGQRLPDRLSRVMIHNDDDALAHSGICLLRRCDAVLRCPGMERAVSLPAAAHDCEGSSPVARRVSSRALRSLPETSREPISRTLDNLWLLLIVAANSFILTEAARQAITGFDCPSLKLPPENRVSAPTG